MKQMKQHTRPRKTCPFRRDSTPGELGGSPVETFVGQTYGAFWIPCHELLDYSDPNWREQYHVSQCAGAAIYRANCHPEIGRPEALLKLPKDTDVVFASPAEFIAHHERISVREAQWVVGLLTPALLHDVQLKRTTSKIIPESTLKNEN